MEAPGDPNIPMSTAVCSVSCNLRADAATRTLQNRRASTVRQNGIDNTILSIPESGLKEEEMKEDEPESGKEEEDERDDTSASSCRNTIHHHHRLNKPSSEDTEI